MIIRFSITNFRSVKDSIEFSMQATSQRGLKNNKFKSGKDIELLKTGVLYGPNASGKSNIIRALKALQYLVSSSSGFKPGDSIAPYEPYLLDKQTVDQPVFFEIEFVHNQVRYNYQLAFNKKSVIGETLFAWPHNVKALIFERTHGQPVKYGENYKGARRNIEKMLLPNQLFISKAAENNVGSVMIPYYYLRSNIKVFALNEQPGPDRFMMGYAKRLAENKNSNFSRRFNKLICALDTGITEVQAKEVDWKQIELPENMPDTIKQTIQKQYSHDVKTIHPVFSGKEEVDKRVFDIEDESLGTRGLFVLGGIILDALEKGDTLVIDEFETNLHPLVTRYLINLFHNPIVNKCNAQLIFATHDATQLSSDTFRRDQVWFTEKDEFGRTQLIRCSDIKHLRLSTPLDKWYLTGKLTGIPIIDDADFLIEMQNEEKA